MKIICGTKSCSFIVCDVDRITWKCQNWSESDFIFKNFVQDWQFEFTKHWPHRASLAFSPMALTSSELKTEKNSSPQFEPSLTESEHLQPLTCVIFNPELVLITCPGPRVSCISIWVEDDQHLIPVARPGFTQIKLAGERAISLARPSERRSQFCVFWLNGFFFLRRVCLLVKDSPKGSI